MATWQVKKGNENWSVECNHYSCGLGVHQASECRACFLQTNSSRAHYCPLVGVLLNHSFGFGFSWNKSSPHTLRLSHGSHKWAKHHKWEERRESLQKFTPHPNEIANLNMSSKLDERWHPFSLSKKQEFLNWNLDCSTRGHAFSALWTCYFPTSESVCLVTCLSCLDNPSKQEEKHKSKQIKAKKAICKSFD